MSRNVFLTPSGRCEGVFAASLALQQAISDSGSKAAVFRPLMLSELCCPKAGKYGLQLFEAALRIGRGQRSEVLENIVANFIAFQQDHPADIYIVEGVTTTVLAQDEINAAIAHALDCDLIVVKNGACARSRAFRSLMLSHFGHAGHTRVLGDVLLNKDAPKARYSFRKKVVLAGPPVDLKGHPKKKGGDACATPPRTPHGEAPLVADIPYDPDNYAIRAAVLAGLVGGKVVHGDEQAAATAVALGAPGAPGQVGVFGDELPGSFAGIAILAGERSDEISGAQAVISAPGSQLDLLQSLLEAPAILAGGDEAKGEHIRRSHAGCYSADFIRELTAAQPERVPLMAPATFRHRLTELARKAHKRIALPEGDEPRTVEAAARVAERQIATPVLIGKKDAILAVAKERRVILGEGVEFIDPDEVRGNYVDRLVELRKSKGLTPEQARDMLQDNVVLATMMIERSEVDGLVSGAVHTTANTIRPPLQIIKTAPGASIVSSVFFMLMPEQVYVFGDCAINPNPNPQELAEIAIQSADTARTFGIDPRVAMLSYSTINSGKGPDVDLVTEALGIVRSKRPDLNIDGPLQYDAAVMEDVARSKAPGSKVAGQATVFIFPSLEAGNVAYKAVQRSADLVSIGPMLQGMKKPVNDLSRGALVDDIIYTIAITAIQATQS